MAQCADYSVVALLAGEDMAPNTLSGDAIFSVESSLAVLVTGPVDCGIV